MSFIEFQMHRHGISINYNRLRRQLILWLALVTIGVSVSIAAVFYWFTSSLANDQEWIALVLLFLSVIKQGILLSIITSYVYLIINLNSRFDTLNISMAWVLIWVHSFPLYQPDKFGDSCFFFSISRDIGTDSSISSNITNTKQKSMNVIEIIKRIGRLHDQLCTIVDNVNFIYSFQVIYVPQEWDSTLYVIMSEIEVD